MALGPRGRGEGQGRALGRGLLGASGDGTAEAVTLRLSPTTDLGRWWTTERERGKRA